MGVFKLKPATASPSNQDSMQRCSSYRISGANGYNTNTIINRRYSFSRITII